MRRAAAALSLLCLAAGTAACGGSTPERVSLRALPRAQLFDQPVLIVVGGLRAGQSVTVALQSTDAAGVPWASAATVRADSHGQAGAGTGLLWSMQPTTHPGDEYYAWRGATQLNFTATARIEGRTVASATLTRRLLPGTVTQRQTTAASAGFAGELFTPAGTGRRPAVVVLGGSSGGLPGFQASTLAARGYPALAVAYFNYPGLPQTLSRIPLEYFARALTWLSRQPGVDPAHVLVLGVSRGSEAALLLGVHYPRLVHGVIGMVPSDVAICSFPGTLDGKPLPYVTRANNPAAESSDPTLAIDEQARAQLWPHPLAFLAGAE
jgi:dienelactone hydrolase